ncbi:MAG: hypothetical protein HGB00_08665 [Chlorobiaceae bacterium]|nr:hypothetical protein [Chlorobiaceae bacterium]
MKGIYYRIISSKFRKQRIEVSVRPKDGCCPFILVSVMSLVGMLAATAPVLAIDSGALSGMRHIGYLHSRYAATTLPGMPPQVNPAGGIKAVPGRVVAMITNNGNAAGQVNVDFNGDGLIRYMVDQGLLDQLAGNNGLIRTDDGLLVMTPSSARMLTRALVSDCGEVRANTLVNKSGRILLVSKLP